jgi:Spy/CpxP family protein refolding chaperone
MRFASRLAGAAALVLAPMSYASAQNAGKSLAMDFRNTVIIQGTPDTGLITGHAVITAD